MKTKETIYNVLFIVIIATSVILGFISVIIGSKAGQKYYMLLLFLIPLLTVGVYIYQKMVFYKILNKLESSWGKKVERKRNFGDIKRLFSLQIYSKKERFYIDDQTWEDLNMDMVYTFIDRTLTIPGEQVLYDILRKPEFDGSKLENRKKLIRLFQDDRKVREYIYVLLHKLGRQRDINVTPLIWGEMPPMTAFRPLFSIMALLALISIVLIPLFGVRMLILVIMPIFGVNFFIDYRVRKHIKAELASLNYLGVVINTARSIGKYSIDGLEEYINGLRTKAASCDKILKNTRMFRVFQTGDITDAFYQYLNVFFLMEVRSFYAVLDEIKKRREELQQIYFQVGKLDAFLSVASYRQEVKDFVEPELFREGVQVNAIGMRHPLLSHPVPNSMNINQEGIIITGCNMSGKSTFLRTLGVNAIFSQTICTCLASSYRASYLKVMTSISMGDNLIGGKSYYLAEAEALLRIINASGDNIPCLCILDEMFRGTNSLERINASAEILSYLVNHNCLAVIATHDYELTELIGNYYRCYYFNENIEEKGISFDYRIKQGVSKTRNAVKLMDYLGYPHEIVDNTNKKIAGYIEK